MISAQKSASSYSDKQILTYFGLSADTKPTEEVANGSAFIEMDTGNLYFYDAENSNWRAWGAEG